MSSVFRFFLILLFIMMQVSLAVDYNGAEYRTKEGFVYGRFEVNYKSAQGTGILSTFFTYHDFTTSTNDWNEIDIEILSRYDNDIQTTTIVPRQTIYNSHSKLPFNPHTDFHTYAFEWTPDYVAWFADGVEFYRQTGEHIQTLVHPQKIMMNMWADDGDGTWTGPWLPETLPYFAYYDWVAYYKYTPDSGNAGTDNNFTLDWRDEFDSWDQDRWEKASHTWGGNRVTFTPNNAVIKDGKLILCLTDSEHQGYMDNVAPGILWARYENKKVLIEFSEAVDSVNAGDISKYSIANATIESLELSKDRRSAVLHVSKFDSDKVYNLIIFGLKDLWNNSKSYEFETILQQQPIQFPLRVNIGGDSLYNGKYLPDQIWGPTVEYGRMDGWQDKYPTSIDIANTEEDSLYLFGRHEIVKYKVRCPAGIYNVVLHLAENKYDTADQRLFNISIEDDLVVSNLDIFKEVGQYAAYDIRVDNIEVTDGILDISFNNWVSDPVLFGLTVEQVSTGIKKSQSDMPDRFNLKQNYPNPFNPETTIEYELSERSFVTLKIYDSTGSLINKLIENYRDAGLNTLRLRPNLASGIYFYQLEARNSANVWHDTKKMLILK